MLFGDGIILGDFLVLMEELVYDYMEIKLGLVINIWKLMMKNRVIISGMRLIVNLRVDYILYVLW